MSPDAVKQNLANRKKYTLRICVIIVITIVVSLGAIIGLRHLAFYAFWKGMGGPRFILRECEPAVLLPDLERQRKIDFPEGIKEVKTARTAGKRDVPVTTSAFNVRFSADPNTVDTFLKSFRTEITLMPYERNSDTRHSSGLRTPEWFTEPITKGKQHSSIGIYIDISNDKNFVVYFMGYYYRDLEELKKEWGKD